jgi:di/tricarboxylate transporter
LTPQIVLTLLILAAAVLLLITEWLPMEVVALLALGAVAITGLVSAADALAGFSSPAVVTVWAVFILSGGLTRTGVGNVVGRQVLKLSGRHEAVMMVVIMTAASLFSAFMNNVAVAALMLPVVMDICRSTGKSPSKLLIPLAYGTLLGGLTTQIGSPPNILVSEALRDRGLEPFKLFDFTPVGLVVALVGIAFMVAVGRHLLPDRRLRHDPAADEADWRQQYDLASRLFVMRVAPQSALVGKTLAESHLGSALGLNVLGITRRLRTLLAPGPAEPIHANDRLVVEGSLGQLEALKNWRYLRAEKERTGVDVVFPGNLPLAEASLPDESTLAGKTLAEIRFAGRFGVSVVAIRRRSTIRRTALKDVALEPGDALLLVGDPGRLEAIRDSADFVRFRSVALSELTSLYHLQERLLVMALPAESPLAGKTLKEMRLGKPLGCGFSVYSGKTAPFATPSRMSPCRPATASW